MEFKAGDRVTVNQHNSIKEKGLTYPSMTVTVSEDGASGGWDVYDGKTDDGKEVSFYGFSVLHVESQ